MTKNSNRIKLKLQKSVHEKQNIFMRKQREENFQGQVAKQSVKFEKS